MTQAISISRCRPQSLRLRQHGEQGAYYFDGVCGLLKALRLVLHSQIRAVIARHQHEAYASIRTFVR
jgi:hypothetical protein